jgi:hypothetical protein
VFAFGISCNKNESPINKDPCAKGKFLYPWCSSVPVSLAVIQVLDTAIGGDVIGPPNKTYKNAVLAHLDVTLLNKGVDMSGIEPSDSVFYFTYVKKYPDFGLCDLGNRPKIYDIRITSILSTPCWRK